jgi:hypothetical protein
VAHLACLDHKRRVLITKQSGEQEVPFAIHREDGTFCQGYSGFKMKDTKFKGIYEVLWHFWEGEDDTVKWPEGMEGEKTQRRKRRRKRKSSGEKLLEEIFTEPGVNLTTQEAK